jgi:hypothetical protein
MRNYSNLVDPDMIAAAQQIEAVLKRYKLMGLVFIASPHRGGFVMEMDAPWNCITTLLDENGEVEGIRLRSKREEFASLEEQKEVLENTVHGLSTILESSRRTFEGIEGLLMRLRSSVKIEQRNKDFRGKGVKIDPPDETSL